MQEKVIEEVEIIISDGWDGGEILETTDFQDIDACAEADEMWSYVGKKSNQVWLWYAIDKKTCVVLAFTFGRRTDEAGKKLCDMLVGFPINRIWTDGWGTYKKHLPADQHCVGKSETQRIERKNLSIRTHVKRLHRKTICFSKSLLMHETVIGLYINKYHFKAA